MSVYRGRTPSKLFRIAVAAVAAAFVDAGAPAEAIPAPDPFFDHANLSWKFRLAGPATATAYSATEIGSSSLNLDPGEAEGGLVRITGGAGSGQARTIISHTSTLLTVEPDWTVLPDSSSTFWIEEAGWRSGSSAESSPARFRVPNDAGRTILVRGLAADEQNLESPDGLAVVTPWTIGGVGSGGTDTNVPPEPVPSVNTPGDGSVEFGRFGFGSLDNLLSVSSAVATLNYMDENAAVTTILTAPAAAGADTMSVAGSGGFEEGDFVTIDRETARIEAISGTTWTVTRGRKGSPATAHLADAAVFRQSTKVFQYAFDPGFLLSPQYIHWRTSERLPNARLANLEVFVVNLLGSSPVHTDDYLTFTSDNGAPGSLPGLRTGRGGQATIQVDGPLYVESAPVPAIPVPGLTSVRDVYAVVRQAPLGAPVTVAVRRNAGVLAVVTVPPGQTQSASVSGASSTPLQPGDLIAIDVTGVGSTSPGEDLSVVVRW